MNLFDNAEWLDAILEAPMEYKECSHSFVTKVIQVGDTYEPENYILLTTTDPNNYPHENEPTVKAKDVFCRLCEMQGSEV